MKCLSFYRSNVIFLENGDMWEVKPFKDINGNELRSYYVERLTGKSELHFKKVYDGPNVNWRLDHFPVVSFWEDAPKLLKERYPFIDNYYLKILDNPNVMYWDY